MTPDQIRGKSVHLITGRLAEPGLRKVVAQLAESLGFAYTIDVLPISVAALLTPKWIAARIQIPADTDFVLVPGYCDTDLSPLQSLTDAPILVGPRDYRQLPEFLGGKSSGSEELEQYSIQIIAEINHAPRLPVSDIVQQALELKRDGADLIDVGCDPSQSWNQVGDCVKALRNEGLRVSIDSFDVAEVEKAIAAGAELVLSVNSSNRDAAKDWDCEVVVIPDEFETLGGLDESINLLEKHNTPYRIDPILEPIGCGFSASLGRYLEVRRRYPQAEMMMGVGNLTELTEVDSAGVNFLLLGICEELKIKSVLTTQVIHWARTSVKECDLARRQVHFAVENQTIPKHLNSALAMLRDAKPYQHGQASLADLHARLKDHNYRIFADQGKLHLINSHVHLQGTDPFEILDQLMATDPKNIDASHAFYLGYELSKALTALTLGKPYRQDEALGWGFLTRPETSHRAKKKQARNDLE